MDNFLEVRSIKYFQDGALGSRGALLLESYSDYVNNYGLELIKKEDLLENTINALKNGFQVCTHAIGDKANRLVLDVYEEALKKTHKKDVRFRIEHAQIIENGDHRLDSKL